MSNSPRYIQFHAACWDDHDLARRLLAADPTLLDARSGLDETVLHDSAIERGLGAVRFLLSMGADPDPVNFTGATPLQECALICKAEHDLSEVIETL